MRNITVRFSLMSALALFAAMIVFGAAVGVFALGRANESTVTVHDVASRALTINDAYKDTTRTRAALTRGYSALKEQNDQEVKNSALKSAQASYDRTLKLLDEFDKAAPFKGQDDKLKADLVNAGRQLSDVLNKAADALRANDTNAYVEINSRDITSRGANFSTQLEKFQKLTKDISEDIVAQRDREYHMVVWLVAAGLVAALILVLGVHFLLRGIVLTPLNRAVALLDQVAGGDLTMKISEPGRNEIGRLFASIRSMQQGLLSTVARVRSSTDIINTGAQEIAAGNLDLSSRTETQASSLEETAASMEQLTGTVKQNAENAQQANQLAHSASETAVKGGEVVAQVVDTMTAINDSSKKIVDIISVIDGIAFQTNILALNAAVEAARAGEQGRGFAVVASEVRSLAQRSAAAAKEIKQLITDSVDKVESGSRLVEQAGLTMGEVVGSVRRVTDIVGEISSASLEQSDGIAQVNRAIAQMDEVTQQNAALVEEAAAAAQSLQTQAVTLAEAVSIFRMEAHTAAAGPLHGSAVPTQRAAEKLTTVKKTAAVGAAAPAPAPSVGVRPALAKPATPKTAPKLPPTSDDDWEQF
ncbi:methyl-accepting chemotaxis protein [Herbaspirillum lusitanum]|uniref:methyl-accepting chemotaxis protein n=1 Tax=Herbaspirillum lusitanum TaxID=213312 RepID=UPI0002FDCE89|nr:methyl-accepting chemotaxis protein [Herbaspirillum lusitanum]